MVTGLAFAVMATNWAGFVAGQLLLGLSMGASNANEMGLRQQLTPDELQGRTAATMRSFNRAMIVIFAPIGGLLGQWLGYRWMLLAAGVGFLLVAAGMGADELPDRHLRPLTARFRPLGLAGLGRAG